MTDDAPLEPINPESQPAAAPAPTTDAAPTEPVPSAAGGAPPPWPTPPANQDVPPPSGSSTVAVPKWLVLVVGALLFAAIGFGVGYAVGDRGHEGHDREASGPRSEFAPPSLGDGRGSGNGPTLPTPTPGQSRSAFLGVAASTSTDPLGARVERVVPGSPAAKAGLQADDVITKIDDQAVTSPAQLATAIGDHKQGDQVTLTYVRGGATKTASATLQLRNAFEIPTTPSTTRPQS